MASSSPQLSLRGRGQQAPSLHRVLVLRGEGRREHLTCLRDRVQEAVPFQEHGQLLALSTSSPRVPGTVESRSLQRALPRADWYRVWSGSGASWHHPERRSTAQQHLLGWVLCPEFSRPLLNQTKRRRKQMGRAGGDEGRVSTSWGGGAARWKSPGGTEEGTFLAWLSPEVTSFPEAALALPWLQPVNV